MLLSGLRHWELSTSVCKCLWLSIGYSPESSVSLLPESVCCCHIPLKIPAHMSHLRCTAQPCHLADFAHSDLQFLTSRLQGPRQRSHGGARGGRGASTPEPPPCSRAAPCLTTTHPCRRHSPPHSMPPRCPVRPLIIHPERLPLVCTQFRAFWAPGTQGAWHCPPPSSVGSPLGGMLSSSPLLEHFI